MLKIRCFTAIYLNRYISVARFRVDKSAATEAEGKKKREMIRFFDNDKVTVDAMDSMLRFHITKAATRRWPVAVFYDLLDKAALNAYIYSTRRLPAPRSPDGSLSFNWLSLFETKSEHKEMPAQPSRKRRMCSEPSCRNGTTSACTQCSRPCCGKHSRSTVHCFSCV